MLTKKTISIYGNIKVQQTVFSIKGTMIYSIPAITGVIAFGTVLLVARELSQLYLEKIIHSILQTRAENFVKRFIFQ
ncbi:MAG: hypothetical protein MSA84_05395 [Lachnospiraceae bacterium]|nr:hypothetical protein [Lachnospiraceae bacterium]